MKRKARTSSRKKTNKRLERTSNEDHKSDDLNSEGVSKDSNSDNACDYQSLPDSDKISLSSNLDHTDRLLIDESNDVSNEYSYSNLSSTSSSESKKSFVSIQLKLISVDKSCQSFTKLEQNFLCISSEANASHVKSYIYKKMSISNDLFDVIFFCSKNLI